MTNPDTKTVAVHARSGGCTKSTMAYELAYLLRGVLVDLEHDGGGVSKMWGYKHKGRIRSPILSGISTGQAPKPLKGIGKPDLVPGHPKLVDYVGAKEEVAALLTTWGESWGREWVVVDAHPGASRLANGAMGAADIALVPVPMRTKDLDALEELADEMPDYPIVVIPSLVPSIVLPTSEKPNRRRPPKQARDHLRSIVQRTSWKVGPAVPFDEKYGERKKKIALSAEGRLRARWVKIAEAYASVAEYVKEYTK